MDTDLHLVVYGPSPGYYNHVPVSDYLVGHANGSMDWVPNLDDSTIELWYKDEMWIGCAWNLGYPGRLAEQFEAAVPRIENNKPAIIRSAVYDGEGVPYILIEPLDHDTDLEISMFSIAHSFYGNVDPDSPAGPELYDYVLANRESLLPDPSGDGIEEFSGLIYPRDVLLNGLKREAKLVRELYAVLQENFPF